MYNSIVDISQFENLVFSALSSLPKRLRDAISNVAIVIENSPRKKHINEIEIKSKGLLLGLYEGIPQTAWGRTQSGVLPDKITIFKQSIESLVTDNNSLKELRRIEDRRIRKNKKAIRIRDGSFVAPT